MLRRFLGDCRLIGIDFRCHFLYMVVWVCGVKILFIDGRYRSQPQVHSTLLLEELERSGRAARQTTARHKIRIMTNSTLKSMARLVPGWMAAENRRPPGDKPRESANPAPIAAHPKTGTPRCMTQTTATPMHKAAVNFAHR